MHVTTRRGFGVVMASLGVLVAVLGCAIYTCAFAGGVASETVSGSEGRRALDVARSCLDEALVEFKTAVNRPGSGWYAALRERPTRPEGMAVWLRGEMPVPAARGLAPDADVRPVRSSVWRDEPILPGFGPYDEKFALLTFTADVAIARVRGFPFRGSVRREVQRSYHLRQVRLAVPPPFGQWTLYVHRVPQLETTRKAYDELIGKFWSRREQIKKTYDQEIRDVVSTISKYLDYMRKKVKDWDKAQEEIDKAKDQLDKLIIAVPLSMGLAAPWAVKLKKALDDMKERLRKDKRTNLDAFGLADEATFRRVAAEPYPPERLVQDISFDLDEGAWPDFRGWRARPTGLQGPGDDLGKPVVVEREQVESREIDYRLDDPEPLPDRPKYDLDPSKIVWLDRYAKIREAFRTYMAKYDASLGRLITKYRAEFQRHETLFRLLRAVPPEYDRLLIDPAYHATRAVWFFDDGESFERAVAPTGGLARLDGVYFVKGGLPHFPPKYRGRGYVFTMEKARLGEVQAAAGSTLVVHSGADVDLDASCDAAVLAPRGRLRSRGGTVGLAAVEEIVREDEFKVVRRKELGEAGPEGLWVNVSPARLGATMLRDPERAD